MTTFAKNMTCCSVCGSAVESTVVISTNSFGASDLDMRPAPMMRWLINTWVQKCPECGYAAQNINDPCPVSRYFLNTESYKTCAGIKFKGDLPIAFFQQAMIAHDAKKTEEEFNALKYAAWACDDLGDSENAVKMRSMALVPLERLLQNKHKDDMFIVHADMMRRAGLFSRVIFEYENKELEDELLNQLLHFEVQKAHEEDDAVYKVSDVRE